MGMMMVQQRSEQSSREADRMAREAELSLRREGMAMRRKEMMSQLQIQREESRAHQQKKCHADSDDAKYCSDQSSAEEGGPERNQ